MAEIVNPYPDLAGDPSVADHVGNRIFPTVAPQDAKAPFIVWQLISNVPFNSLSGCRPDADSQRLQVDIYADDPAAARELAFSARDAMPYTVVEGPTPDIDPDTRLYRWSFDCLHVFKRVVA